MPAMRAALLFGFALIVASCGPSQTGGSIKTPQERIAEQEALAIEDERRAAAKEQNYTADDLADDDEKKPYDVAHAKRELTRAARNASDCPKVVTEEVTAKEAMVRLKFNNDGKVIREQTKLSGVAADSSIGRCVLNAMQNVIVPKYTGDEVEVDWKISFVSEDDSASE
jgi:hypothetical protein